MSRTSHRDGSELIDAEGRRLLDRYAALGRFSGVAMVARHGEVVFAAALGLADRGAVRPLSPSSRFAFGSLSKQFTAAAVVGLAAEGALSLSDPIGRHLGDLGLPFAGAVTALHLLTHRAGIPSLFKPHLGIELSDARASQPASRAELCDRFRHLPLRFQPGTRYEYSNSGYALLALLVERVSGLSWQDYLRDRLLGPAGLTRTSTAHQPDDAIGYLAGQPALRAHPSWLVGSGDLIGPAADLVAWDAAGAGRARRSSPGSPGYDGLYQSLRRGRRVLHHDGALAGFVTTYHRLPDDDLVVVVLTNSVPGWPHVPLATRTVNQMADQLADLALGQAPTGVPAALPAPAGPEVGRLTGRYQLGGADGLELAIRLEGGRLWAETAGARPWTLWGLADLAGLDATPRAQRAAGLLAALAEGRFTDALALFAPDNARALPAGALAELWQNLCRQAGTAPTFRLFQLQGDVAYLRATTPPLDAVVSFDDADRVVGFHVVPPGVGLASSTVELIPADALAGDGGRTRWCADGYPLAAPDVELSFDGTGERAEALTIHLGEGYRAQRT